MKGLKRDSTSGKVSVAVAAATLSAKPKRRWPWVAAAGLAVAAALIWFFVPASPLKVLGITQISHDGYPMGNMLTDGARIYVTQWRPEGLVLEQASTTGGETSSIPSPIKSMWIDDISPDHSQLLVNTAESTRWLTARERELLTTSYFHCRVHCASRTQCAGLGEPTCCSTTCCSPPVCSNLAPDRHGSQTPHVNHIVAPRRIHDRPGLLRYGFRLASDD